MPYHHTRGAVYSQPVWRSEQVTTFCQNRSIRVIIYTKFIHFILFNRRVTHKLQADAKQRGTADGPKGKGLGAPGGGAAKADGGDRGPRGGSAYGDGSRSDRGLRGGIYFYIPMIKGLGYVPGVS